MKYFFVAYDLQRPGQNYNRIGTRLQELGAKRVLESTWVVRSGDDVTDVQLRDHLMGFIDQNDRLLVVHASSWAWVRLMFDPSKA